MMKNLRWFLLFFLVVGLLGSYNYSYRFLSGDGISVDAGVTKINVTDFDSKEVSIRVATQVALTIVFDRAAGSSSTVEFAFEGSYDGGTTWATFEDVTILVATDHPVISGTTVRVLKLVNTPGVSHIRWESVTNNDGANDITNCNVVLSK